MSQISSIIVLNFKMDKGCLIYVDESDPDLDEWLPNPCQVSIRRSDSFYDDFELNDELGEGAFGSVFKCKEKQNGVELAAKFINPKTKLQKDAVENEIKILKRLEHIRIAHLFEVYENSLNERVLIMELIEGGQLLERIVDDHFVLSEKAIVSIVRQICDGVNYIHSNHIVHLDLKPENILCTSQNGNRIKLIDFGVARFFDSDKELRAVAGTPEFSAPEVVNYENISFASDMWSIGIICYLLLSGTSPFLGTNDCETYSNVIKCQWYFTETFSQISQDAKDFITSLLIYKKEERLNADQCLQHKWLRIATYKNNSLEKDELKRYLIQRRWKKALNVFVAIRRMISPNSQNVVY